MKLKDFLLAQARKAGVQVTTELDNVPEFDMPEDVAKGIDTSMISIQEAKNNHPEIKNHYQKQSLDTVDKVLQKVLEANPDLLDDEDLKNERSTYKRVELITSKIQTLADKKAGAGSNKQKDEIQKEIDALHAKIRELNETRESEKQSHQTALLDFKRKTQLSQLLSGQKTIHDELPSDVKTAILETLLNKELQDNNAKFDFDDSGRFILLKNDGTNFFGENHQQVLPDKFIEQTLAKHKQLKVSNGQPGATTTQTKPVTVDAGNKNASIISRNLAALEDYKKGSQINADIMR